MDAVLQATLDEITKIKDTEAAATAALNSVGQRITDAVNAALAGASTISDADKAAIQQAIADATASNDALASAVAANTTAGPAVG